jgi:hypothetical protein
MLRHVGKNMQEDARGGWDLIKSVTDHVPKSREDDE